MWASLIFFLMHNFRRQSWMDCGIHNDCHVCQLMFLLSLPTKNKCWSDSAAALPQHFIFSLTKLITFHLGWWSVLVWSVRKSTPYPVFLNTPSTAALRTMRLLITGEKQLMTYFSPYWKDVEHSLKYNLRS